MTLDSCLASVWSFLWLDQPGSRRTKLSMVSTLFDCTCCHVFLWIVGSVQNTLWRSDGEGFAKCFLFQCRYWSWGPSRLLDCVPLLVSQAYAAVLNFHPHVGDVSSSLSIFSFPSVYYCQQHDNKWGKWIWPIPIAFMVDCQHPTVSFSSFSNGKAFVDGTRKRNKSMNNRYSTWTWTMLVRKQTTMTLPRMSSQGNYQTLTLDALVRQENCCGNHLHLPCLTVKL